MATVEQSVDVNVDVATAYDQWAQFESFPRWMEGVAAVEQVDDGHLHWIARVRNEFATVENETSSGTPGSPRADREWDARITAQIRNERISWESIVEKPDEKPNAGEVTFEPLGDSSCRVTFGIDWEPEGGLETTSEVLDAVNQVVAADLARFKDFIEGRGEEAGSWRGEIAV